MARLKRSAMALDYRGAASAGHLIGRMQRNIEEAATQGGTAEHHQINPYAKLLRQIEAFADWQRERFHHAQLVQARRGWEDGHKIRDSGNVYDKV